MPEHEDEQVAKAGEADYLEPYAKAVKEHGPGFEALLWNSADAQNRRFDAITSLCHPSGRVIADMGCGQADFALWLNQQKIPCKRYLGVEAIQELQTLSQERIKDLNLGEAKILHGEFVADEGLFDRLVRDEGVDLIVFSGSLNTLEQDQAVAVLKRAMEALDGGRGWGGGGALVFNFLAQSPAEPERAVMPPAKRFATLRMIRWALVQSPLVSYRQDYLQGHDATICIRAAGD